MALAASAPEGLDYHDRPDEDLVSAAKAGENLAMELLLNKYKNFVRIKAKSYFLIGADREDIIQEGMIGLYKAVRDFKADKLSSFRAFAELCITRQIITAIKTATRQKHIPLNQYISLNKPIYDEDSERTLLDVMASQKTSDPEELVINQEVSEDIKERIQENLSDLESQVLLSYLEGKSYQEMARDLNRHVKSIDNALQRVKRKIEKNLAEIELPYARATRPGPLASRPGLQGDGDDSQERRARASVARQDGHPLHQRHDQTGERGGVRVGRELGRRDVALDPHPQSSDNRAADLGDRPADVGRPVRTARGRTRKQASFRRRFPGIGSRGRGQHRARRLVRGRRSVDRLRQRCGVAGVAAGRFQEQPLLVSERGVEARCGHAHRGR